MATIALHRIGCFCAVSALIFMFISFATPYWYQSWTRVHSSFGSIGLWHICLNGFIKPRDAVMKSYVGCWWIHSTEFSKIDMDIQPVWFRFVQAFAVFALIGDLLGAIFTILYIPEGTRGQLYKKRPRMFFINSALLLAAGFLVFLISLVFAEMSHDSTWMPRPWMNYLSWSYGLCVLSGFFSTFAGMCLFVLALVFKDKEDNGDPGVTSAAELAAKRRALEKQDEAMRSQPGMMMDPVPPQQQYGGVHYRQPQYRQEPAYQDRPDNGGHREFRRPPGPPSVASSKVEFRKPPGPPSVASSNSKVGESFV